MPSPISVSAFSAVVCLTFSSCFHWLYCKSLKVYLFMVRLDYCGVCGLIAGSYLPWLFYSFYCDPFCQKLYLSCVALLGSTTFFLIFLEKFQSQKWVLFKTCTFIGFGMFAWIPLFHLIYRHGLYSDEVQCWLVPFVTQGFAYLLGAFVFYLRIPECWFPGRVDLVGQSHTIWHMFVVVGALLNLYTCYRQYNYRQLAMCSAEATGAGAGVGGIGLGTGGLTPDG